MNELPDQPRLEVAVVEDDPAVLDAVTLVLEAQGWRARGYSSGEEFLADYQQRPDCDCVLLDPHLPGITGVDVALAMSGSCVPLLVVTARPDSPVTRSLVALGAGGVVVKPVGAAELVGRISELANRSVPVH